jgi:hypothetical protein
MNAYTMTWMIIPSHAPDSMPEFGRESDVSLNVCLKRIKGIWQAYDCSEEERRPLAWAYEIKDRHGRTVDNDRLVDGKWMELTDNRREYQLAFYASHKMLGPVYP